MEGHRPHEPKVKSPSGSSAGEVEVQALTPTYPPHHTTLISGDSRPQPIDFAWEREALTAGASITLTITDDQGQVIR